MSHMTTSSVLMTQVATWAVPIRAQAAWMMSAFRPSRAAMLRALERPGMPHMRRYVGASLASSNSTLAFSKRSSWYLSDVSELRKRPSSQWTDNIAAGTAAYKQAALGGKEVLEVSQQPFWSSHERRQQAVHGRLVHASPRRGPP